MRKRRGLLVLCAPPTLFLAAQVAHAMRRVGAELARELHDAQKFAHGWARARRARAPRRPSFRRLALLQMRPPTSKKAKWRRRLHKPKTRIPLSRAKDTQPLTEEENWSIWAANLPAHMEAAPFTSDRARHGLKQDWLETTEPKWGLGWAKDVRHKMAGTRAVPLKDAGVGRLTMPKKPKPPVSEEDRLYALKIETDVQNPPMSSLPPPKAIAEAKAKAARVAAPPRRKQAVSRPPAYDPPPEATEAQARAIRIASNLQRPPPEQLQKLFESKLLYWDELEMRERYIGAYADEEARSGVLPNVYTDGSLIEREPSSPKRKSASATPATPATTTRSSQSGPPSSGSKSKFSRRSKTCNRPARPRRPPRPARGCGKNACACTTATPLEASSTVRRCGSCSVAAGSRSSPPSRIGYSTPSTASRR